MLQINSPFYATTRNGSESFRVNHSSVANTPLLNNYASSAFHNSDAQFTTGTPFTGQLNSLFPAKYSPPPCSRTDPPVLLTAAVHRRKRQAGATLMRMVGLGWTPYLRFTIYDLRAHRFALALFGNSDGFAVLQFGEPAWEAAAWKVVATNCRHPVGRGLSRAMYLKITCKIL